MKKAILFGASGFIGSFLLEELLKSPDYDQVVVVVRKKLKTEHPKLKMLMGDLQSLPGLKGELKGDEVFIALGTTRKKVPRQDEYYKVDHDYPVLAAQLARENGCRSVFLVSSVGADVESRSFYLSTKGKAERDIVALGFDHTHLFRPSMLLGSREEERPLEKLLIGVWSVIDPVFVGALSPYRGIQGSDVARAMIAAARKGMSEKVRIYHSKEMREL